MSTTAPVELLTIRQAAERRGVSYNVICQWLQRGLLKPAPGIEAEGRNRFAPMPKGGKDKHGGSIGIPFLLSSDVDNVKTKLFYNAQTVSDSNVPMGEKCCSCCKEIKPLSAFTNAANGTFGKYAYCRECANKKAAIYREQNPVSAKALRSYKRKWRTENQEHIREYARAYRAKKQGVSANA